MKIIKKETKIQNSFFLVDLVNLEVVSAADFSVTLGVARVVLFLTAGLICSSELVSSRNVRFFIEIAFLARIGVDFGTSVRIGTSEGRFSTATKLFRDLTFLKASFAP